MRSDIFPQAGEVKKQMSAAVFEKVFSIVVTAPAGAPGLDVAAALLALKAALF
jgi:hypothetical protein